MKDAKPNILIVMDDQHHHSYFGFLGKRPVRTPNFDEFAKEGVVFSNAFTSCPLCTPARVGLLTGIYPHGTQIYTNNPEERCRPDLPLLPNTFCEHGYFTGTTGKYHAAPLGHAQWDFKGDMDEYVEFLKARGKERGSCYLGPSYDSFPSPSIACSVAPLAEDETRTAYEANMALDFLDARPKDKPFLLWMNFDAPHGPYHLAERYAKMYSPDEMPLPELSKEDCESLPPEQKAWASFRSYDTMTGEQLRKALAFYCGSISEVDFHFGRIIQKLKAEGLYENTVIIFLSDHGDHAGDHRWVNKSFAYDSTIRIPMIAHIPGVKPQVRTKMVQNVDIFPTLCDLLGIPTPDSVQGNSFASLLDPVGYKASRIRDFIISEELHYRTIRTAKHKLVYAPSRYTWEGGNFTTQLYDMEADPSELRNLAGMNEFDTIKASLLEHLLDAYCSTELPLGGDIQKITVSEHSEAYGKAYAAQREIQRVILAREADDFKYEVYLPSREAVGKPSLGGG